MKKLEELAAQKSFWHKSQSEQNQVLKEISDLKQENALWTELCLLERDVEANVELCEEQIDKDLFLELETNIKQFQNKIQSQENVFLRLNLLKYRRPKILKFSFLCFFLFSVG